MNRIIYSTIIIFFASIIFHHPHVVPAETSKNKGSSIKWESVDGAIGYIIEVKDMEDKIVLRKKVIKTSVSLDLPNGKYYLRIGPVNKFSKVSIWSDWSKVSIKKPVPPIIASISPDTGNTGRISSKITIKGKYLLTGCKVFIKGKEKIGEEIKEKSLAIRKVKYESHNKIIVTVDLRDASLGKYNLTVINPSGFSTIKKNIFTVIEQLKPEFNSMVGKSGFTGRKVIDSAIRGKYLQKGTLVYISKDKTKIPATGIIYESEKLIRFDFDLDGVKVGLYDLVIEDPTGFTITKRNLFHVKPHSGKAHSSNINLDGRYFKVAAGFPIYVVESSWAKYYTYSMAGANFMVGMDFKFFNFMRSITFVNRLGIEIENTYAYHRGKNTDNFSVILTGFNLYFYTSLVSPLNIYFRFGSGIANSQIKDVNDGFTQDPFIKAGISIEYRITGMFFIELGTAFHSTMYIGKDFMSIRFLLQVGVRF
ncbi:hypothetical protein ACFL20_12610 [Spirochaetota bacterium]